MGRKLRARGRCCCDFMVGGHAIAPATFSSITSGHDRLFDVGQFFAQSEVGA